MFGVASEEGVPSSLSLEDPPSQSQGLEEPIIFPCEECDQVFRFNEALQSHAARKHGYLRWVL